MTKKTSKKQKTLKTGEVTPTEVTPTTSEVPAPEPAPQDDAASAIAPTPPAPPTPPTPPTPTPPKPALVSLKKASDTSKESPRDTLSESLRDTSRESLRERHAEGRFDRKFDRSSDDRPKRRSLPAPSKPPAKFDECGNYKAGDQTVLPHSGRTVEFTYFYQGSRPEEWWGVFEGGCVRISTLSSEMPSN